MIVPTPDALATLRRRHRRTQEPRCSESLQRTRAVAELQSYEVPVDFLIETEPFSADNGLLSGVGKLLRPNLKAHYGERLEQLYADLADAQVDELRALRETAADQPVIDTLTRAATVTPRVAADVDADAHFTDLGGDSLSALTFSNLLHDLFGVEVPVGVIIGPPPTCVSSRNYIEAERDSAGTRPTFDVRARRRRHRGRGPPT